MRIKLIIGLFFIVWIALLVRVYYLSININTYYETLSQKNIIRQDAIPTIRGVIKDRNGELLANNKLGFSIKLVPHLNNNGSMKVLEENCNLIASTFSLNADMLIKEYTKKDSIYNHSYIPIVDFISYEDVTKNYYKFSFQNNIKIEPAIKRYYPQNDIASHVIGYISKANKRDYEKNSVSRITNVVGKSGIEKFYNQYLQGESGYRTYKVTAFNEEIELLESQLPDDNHDLTLTLDLRIQKFIHELFAEQAGAVIVMKTNGEILAAGSYPEYDSNMFIDGVSVEEWDRIRLDLNHPFTNKLVNGLYPPGSIIKTGVALSFLENGIRAYDTFYCTGSFEYSGRNYRCWKEEGHERTNMVKAIKESCDDYFYKGSLNIGINDIASTLRRMGLASKTGVDLPNEFYGVIPDKDWKRDKYDKPWFLGETLISSIGQGYTLVTPMQITQYTSLIASGELPTPHFLKQLGEQVIDFPTADVFNENNKKNIHLIRKAMYKVVNEVHGTAVNYIRTGKIKMAGKTGTAQVVSIPQSEKQRMKEEQLKYFQRSHAWFSGYFPYEKPKYVITILAEHGGHGGAATGWAVNKIVKYMEELGYDME